MKFAAADLADIVGRSSTLSERLRARFVRAGSAEEDLVSRRLKSWCEMAAFGDWDRFEARLAAEGLNLDDARRALGSSSLQDPRVMPAWAHTLWAIIERIASGQASDGRDASLFEPFIELGRAKLLELANPTSQLLSESALAQLEGDLRARLADTARAAMLLRFDAFCAARCPLFFEPAQDLRPEAPMFRDFARHMLSGGWITCFSEFPVLARLLATVVDFWVEFARTFLEHLAEDLPAVRECFAPGCALSSVVGIQAGLSDPHHGGRSVLRITFDSGLELMYKPRDLGMDAAWFALLEWLNKRGIAPPFMLLQVLSRTDHGWMQVAEGRPCMSEEDAGSYYRCAGALLCLIYVLDGSDFLSENVIHSGDQPVLIDLETLMQPRVDLRNATPASRRFPATVLRTHFLPRWEVAVDGGLLWVGGMDHPQTLHKTALSPVDFQCAVLDGFREMYRFLLQHGPALTQPGGPIGAFAGRCIRPIFQDTRIYAELRSRSLQPEVLRDGADRSIVLEYLNRLPVASGAIGGLLGRCQQEIQMIERLDIPWFQTRTTSRNLWLESSGPVIGHFAEAALDGVTAGIQQLNEEDLERQVELIMGTFCFRAALGSIRPSIAQDFEPGARVADAEGGRIRTRWEGAPARDSVGGSSGDLTDAVLEIADRIARTAIPVPSEGTRWAIPEQVLVHDRYVYRFAPSDVFLYGGNAGIALFLAAVESVVGRGRWGGLARSALLPVLSFLESPLVYPRASLGAAVGLGSVVYALVKTSALLSDPSLLRAARKAAGLITSERIAEDRKFDVYDGAAGAILGLLSLYESVGDSSILMQARECGDHLIACRTASPSGHRVWKTGGGQAMSGLAHGVAGIAYALLRLSQATGRQHFLEAADEAICFERTAFSAAHGNWRAFGTSAENPVFWTAVCHGATGIGLARLGGLPMLDTPEIRDEIELAVDATKRHSWDGVDFLCCGNAGRIGLLSALAEERGRSELLERARSQAARLLELWRTRGGFRLQSDLPGPVDSPGFFRGTAGIGYEFLRLACPNRLPCVLLWR